MIASLLSVKRRSYTWKPTATEYHLLESIVSPLVNQIPLAKIEGSLLCCHEYQLMLELCRLWRFRFYLYGLNSTQPV